MNILEIFFVFSIILKMSQGLRCYSCVPVHKTYNKDELLCEHFDYSDKYIVDCQLSSMCHKKAIKSNMWNELTLYKRGCADQTIKGYQEFINGEWVYLDRIFEVNAEGCTEADSNDMNTQKSTNCFCKGDLCNSSSTVTLCFITIFTAMVSLYIFR